MNFFDTQSVNLGTHNYWRRIQDIGSIVSPEFPGMIKSVKSVSVLVRLDIDTL